MLTPLHVHTSQLWVRHSATYMMFNRILGALRECLCLYIQDEWNQVCLLRNGCMLVAAACRGFAVYVGFTVYDLGFSGNPSLLERRPLPSHRVAPIPPAIPYRSNALSNALRIACYRVDCYPIALVAWDC
jgi:hypothetical protein